MMTVLKQFRVDANAYDIAAADNGLIFLSSRSGGWADVAVVDWKKGKMVGRWGGVWTNSLLRLSMDQSRLYVSSQGVSPGKLEAFPIPVRLEEKPTSYPAARDAAAGGPFALTPDGQFLILQSGSVLRLSSNRGDDLQIAGKLPAHLAAAADPDSDRLFVLATDGLTIKQFSYPELKWQKSFRLPALAHQLAFDGKTNRLYAAVTDPQSFRDDPRAKGAGAVHIYEIGERNR
jgi:hypothetical protein